MLDAPVTPIPGDGNRGPDEGTALCLSGGGYRAMVFHVGALWRLYEAGLLGKLQRISSVSGGSIVAGVLALKWGRLVDGQQTREKFERELVAPVRALAGETIDDEAVILGLALPGHISDRISKAYDRSLFHGATLQDLPDQPRFVINATNVQSGALWRFMKPYMRDWRVGEVKSPTISLAQAVTASSAFPPVLSPFEMQLDPAAFTPGSGADLQRVPFTSKVLLADGGVYDNLGLETAWKRYKTILVSDGGAKMADEEEPKRDWARHSYRVLNLIDNQVRALRKRQIHLSFDAAPTDSVHREGAYWGILSNIAEHGPGGTLPCPPEQTLALAQIPTRLKRLDDVVQDRLINWGYAICDAALRTRVDPTLPPASFPYPRSGVG